MAESDFLVSCISKREKENYLFNGEILQKTSLENIPKKSQIALTLGDKNFISYFFEIDNGLDNQTQNETVEVKMFQEAGLNPLIEYEIFYHTVDSDTDATKLNIQAFAINKAIIEEKSKTLLKTLGFIDVILPTTTLPLSLYSSKTLEEQNDVFIYFVNNSLYLSIFKSGNLIYGKTIDKGVLKIREELIRILDEEMPLEKFIVLLITKGISRENYSFEEEDFPNTLKEIFIDVANIINSVLQYVMRKFNINSFSRIFLGSKYGVISGLPKLFEELLYVKGYDYLFYCKYFSKEDSYIDQRDILMLLELEHRKNPFNATLYKRPLSFFKRKSGSYISFLSMVVLIISIFLFIPYYQAKKIDLKIENKLSELRVNKQEFNEFKLQEKKLLSEKAVLNKKLKNIQNGFQDKRALLEEISKKVEGKKRVVAFLNKLFFELNTKEIKVNKVSFFERKFMLDIQGGDQQKITALIQKLTLENYIVAMDAITYERGVYRSNIKVDLK